MLTNLLVSKLCSAGENVVNLAVMDSKLRIPARNPTWIATNKMSDMEIEAMVVAIGSKSAKTWEYIFEMNESLFVSNPVAGGLSTRAFKAVLMVYTMPHPTHVYYRRPHVGAIPLTAQDHHCHTLL